VATREEFDYVGGTRWFNYERLPNPPVVENGNIVRLGSPLETDGDGFAVVGRGPYFLGRFEHDYSLFTDYAGQPDDMELALNRFTGYGTNLMTGFTFADEATYEGYDDYYEFRLAAGSPGPTGTGIFHIGVGGWSGISVSDDVHLLNTPMQVCWNQADGVWIEVLVITDFGLATCTSTLVTIPLVASTADAVTIGVAQRALRPDEYTEQPVFDFYVDDVLVVQSLDLATGDVLEVENEPLGSPGPGPIHLFVIDPVPEEDLLGFPMELQDFVHYPEYPILHSPWAESNAVWTAEAEGAIYYYDGVELPRVFEWVDTYADFVFLDAPPLVKLVGQLWPRGDW
jgi:hypothetical protein